MRVLVFVLVVCLIVCGVASAQLTNAPWPMFHHDLNHTGRSPYTGPGEVNVKWSYSTGNWVESSPAVASDGTIYIGSDDGKLYALADLTPPRVSIISPQNTTYGTSTITINVSAYNPSGIDKVIAQIDGTTNITLTYSNSYYIGTVTLADGDHYIRIYVNDTFGNVNSSEIVYFKVNTSVPSIIYVPDDYAKIKWAVDNATAGSTIYVRNGTYSEYNINVSKSLRIIGLNYPLLVSPVDRGTFYGFNVTADDVLIKGFEFGKFEGYSLWGTKYGTGYAVYIKSDNVTVEDCNFSIYNDKGIDYGVYVKGDNVRVKNCTFDTRIGTAVKLMNAEKVSISNNTFREVASAVDIISSANVTVNKNVFEDDWSSIYSGINSENVSILNNYIKGKDCEAIEVHSANSTIKGNMLVNVRYGIAVTGGADGTSIEDNVIDGVLAGYTGGAIQGGAYGIYLESENIVIINNTIRNSTYIGMWIKGENITMRNNTMENNLFNFRYDANWYHPQNDIDTSNRVDGKPIYYSYNESNFVVNYQDAGMVILVKCSNVTVKDVSVSNNFEGIVLSGCSNVTIENSTITKNFWGILSVWDSRNVRIENNEIFRNYEWGINVGGGDKNLTIINNEIHENGNGILVKGFYGYVWRSFKNVYIADNRIYNNTLKELANWYNIGIKVALADNVTIENNEIHDNSNGIGLTTSDQGGWFSIKNNRVYDNNYGIYARDGGDCEIISNEFVNNNYGIRMDQWVCVIERNLFKQNEYGLYIDDSTVEGKYNEIVNNTIGLTTVLSTINMSFNNITQNRKGVVVGEHYWHKGGVNLTFNNIINKEYNIVNEETFNVSAINNWWGTTNESLIEEKILDYYDDNTTGIVFYKPYLDHYVVWGVKGDFNNNGRVDIGDVSYVAYIIIGKVKHDLRADFNNNGRVDIGDLAKIAYYLLGKVQEL